LLTVGGHVLDDLEPRCVRMATGLALTLSTRYRQRFVAEFGDTLCARLRETVVYAPGGLGSCAVLVERAATILLGLLAEVEQAIWNENEMHKRKKRTR